MPNYRNYNRYTRYHELYEANKSNDAPKTLTQKWIQSNGLLDAENIVIPDGVTSLGEECFYDREYLENVKIPSSVTSIGNSCFAYCSSLKNIKLPNSVTSLGDKCFYSCSSLKAITIPGSVKRIGKSAFRNCTSLTDVYYGGTEKDVQKIKIDSSETTLLDATWHYNSKGVNEHLYSNIRTSRHYIREGYERGDEYLREMEGVFDKGTLIDAGESDGCETYKHNGNKFTFVITRPSDIYGRDERVSRDLMGVYGASYNVYFDFDNDWFYIRCFGDDDEYETDAEWAYKFLGDKGYDADYFKRLFAKYMNKNESLRCRSISESRRYIRK